MLSPQERMYVMFPKEFLKKHGSNYTKKIRNLVRKKMVRATIDIFYSLECDEIISSEKQEPVIPICVSTLHELLKYYELPEEKRKKEDLLSFISFLEFSMRKYCNNYPLKLNPRLTKLLESSLS